MGNGTRRRPGALRRSRLGATIPLAAFGLLLAACGGGSHNTNASTSASSSTTLGSVTPAGGGGGSTTTSSAKSSAASGSGSAGSGSSAAKASATTAAAGSGTASGSASLGAPQNPGAASSPKDGYYKYKSSDSAGDVTQLKLQVSETSPASGGVNHQKLQITTSNGSETDTYDWGPSGVNVNSTALSGGSFSADCTWKTPIQEYVFSSSRLSVGASWKSTSSGTCTASGFPAGFAATEQMSATVQKLDRISEAGKVIDCWVLARHSVFMANDQPAFSLTIDTTSTEWFSPKYGQMPKTMNDTKTNGSYQGRAFSNEQKTTVEAETMDPSATAPS